MRPTEAGAVYAYASRIDPRLGRVDDDVMDAWAPLLAGLTVKACCEAVDRHYRDRSDRIMPSDIRALARTSTDGDRGPVTLSPEVEGRPGARVEETHAGEVLCPDCMLVHRRSESCEEFAANRRGLPRPVGRVTRELTAEVPSRSDAVRELALQRARAERGNVPWSPPVGDDGGAPREERDEVDVQPSLAVLSALRDAPIRACVVCVAGPSGAPTFADVPEGRAGHQAVFGHAPRASAPSAAAGTDA